MQLRALCRFLPRALTLGAAAAIFASYPGCAIAADQPPARKSLTPATNEFDTVGVSVVELLKSRDTTKFARDLSPSAEAWQALASTNLPERAEVLKGMAAQVPYYRDQLEAAAKALLAKADSLHLDFSNGVWNPKITAPRSLGNTHFPNLQAKDDYIPYADKIEIVLTPGAAKTNDANGEFKLALRQLLKFPMGWRTMGGIHWASFPTNVADEKTIREIAILDKVENHSGLTDRDDPALAALGETVAALVRTGDTNQYAKHALASSDMVWEEFQQYGRRGPSREEMDAEVAKQTARHLQGVESFLKQMRDAGVDLKDAKVRVTGTSVSQLRSRRTAASLAGLMGEGFKVKLNVETDHKTKSGAAVAGDYTAVIKRISRYGDGWKAMDDLRWYEVPPGVLDEKTLAEMNLENYVSEHGTLPRGTAAPEIEFTVLDGDKKMKLSDLRGKVVVLDFWATWCGPCQKPMAELQKLREAHAGWGDKVAIVPLSIDDTEDVLRAHLNKRGWTNTFNVWAGPGGWQSGAAKTFRVSSVPTTYILDARGNVATAGHPAAMPIGERVDELLAAPRN